LPVPGKKLGDNLLLRADYAPLAKLYGISS
jgi:hypothetical protein